LVGEESVVRVYYNEIDPFAAAWLRALVAKGEIPAGDVDERSIVDVGAADLKGYDQCHFFAGIGGWPLALNQAGWGTRKVWTGSCPCQPFSSAGRQEGVKDERHLWPAFFSLIEECKPPVVIGEQVASAISKDWLDIVFANLEGEGYACGATVFGAHSAGAPHIRKRLYWLGDSQYGRSLPHKRTEGQGRHARRRGSDGDIGVAHSAGAGLEGSTGSRIREQKGDQLNGGQGGREKREAVCGPPDGGDVRSGSGGTLPDGTGFWKGWEWLSFRDSKRRPIEPGTFPLVDGVPERVGRLRGYGNALCVPQASAFIKAYLEVIR
jgi:DNA (cytosine-5)-methyltransferase 1